MKNLFNNRKIKYSTFSSVLTILVIIVLIMANLLFETLNFSFDMTKDKSNSLSAETLSYLSGIDKDITIYPLYKTGEVYKPFEEIFSSYERASKHINVEYIDPYQNPQFVQKYKTNDEDIPIGSVIVENGDRFKVVSGTGLIEAGEVVTVYNLEPKLTNAIIYVNSEETSKIYNVVGHNEIEVGKSIYDALETANFERSDINLMNEDIPEDCDVLVLTTPQNDYNKDETKKVIDYLNGGGKAFITVDVLLGANKPNYDSIIETFGISKGDYLVIETDTSKFVDNIPINVIASVENTEITKNLFENGRLILTPTTTGIELNENLKSTTTVTPLLKSTVKSFGKKDFESSSLSYTQGDETGPFTIAALVNETHSLATDEVTSLVVVGTSAIIDEQINAYVGGGNQDFVVASMKYLVGNSEDIYLSPKVVTENTVTLNFSNVIFIIVYSAVFLPLLILGIGFFVFFRRKNR